MSYSEIRAKARQNLRGQWAISIAVVMVAVLLGGILFGNSFLPEVNAELAELLGLEDVTILEDNPYLEGMEISIAPLGTIQFILGGVIQLGLAQFLLKQHDGAKAEFSDLFSQFDRFGQGFLQHFLRGLYTALWTLLFIIPGIIAGYKYAMTPYIMADHPELTASEAIKASCELMDGHKGELFTLHLTFLGWDLLAMLTLNLGYIVLNPYKSAAETAFYRELAAMPKITVE